MPWTFEFMAATKRSVLAGLMSPRSNFLLTRRRGMGSIFHPFDLFGLLETNSGSLPLSTAQRRKTRWRSTCVETRRGESPETVNFSRQWVSLAKILTSSAFWSNASTRFTRKSKQSSVKRSVRALSNPGGAGDISKGFLLPYCMQFMLRWEKLLSHQLSETHQEIKWDVSWWLAGQVGEDNLQTIRGWVGPHVSTTTWQGKEM